MTESPRDDQLLEHLLVLRAQVGDRDAHERLFERHSDRLRYYARRMLGARQEVDDLLQETWLTVVRKISTLEDPRAFRSWLYRIARNHVLSGARKRNIEISIDDPNSDHELVLVDDDTNFLERHSASDVNLALERVQAAQREVLTLRFIEDLTYEEIASVVGCSVGTVRSRIHYGKRDLQANLANENGDKTKG